VHPHLVLHRVAAGDLADPAGKALAEVRAIRDDIDRRVRALLVELIASSA
jgi:hypothetical protein